MLEQLCGGDSFKTALAAALRESDGGAVLIIAPDGCGRNYAARLAAADFLDDNPQLVLGEKHPDCLVVRGTGKSGQIPIADIRACDFEINKAPALAQRRAVIIENAADLTAGAANALLKTLEQPPRGVLFLLTATDSGALPATVLSRCRVFALGEVSVDAARAYAAANLPPVPNEAYEVFGGRLGALEKAARGEVSGAELSAALALAKAAVAADKLDFMALLDNCAERAAAVRLLDFAGSALRLRLGGKDTRRVAAVMRILDSAAAQLKKNVSPRLAGAAAAAQL